MSNSMLDPQRNREVKLPSAFKRPFVCVKQDSELVLSGKGFSDVVLEGLLLKSLLTA